MGSVRISRKAAQALLDVARDAFGGGTKTLWAAVDELERALTPKPKSSAVKKTERKRREKAVETADVYGAVAQRAGEKCEACGLPFTTYNRPEMDHFFGKAKARQAPSNCWLLCRICHRKKTDSDPIAARWFERFITHARVHGYRAEAERAQARLDAITMTRGA